MENPKVKGTIQVKSDRTGDVRYIFIDKITMFEDNEISTVDCTDISCEENAKTIANKINVALSEM